MGIRFWCPNGHKLNVKAFQAGRRGVCPYCGARFQIPTESTRRPGTKDLIPEPLEHSVHEAGGGVPPTAAPVAPAQGVGLAAAPAGPSDAALYAPSAAQGYGGPGGYAAGQAGVGQAGPATAGSTLRAGPGPGTPLDAGPGFAPGGATTGPMLSAPLAAYPSVPLAPATVPPASAAAPSMPGDPLSEAPDAVWYVRPPAGGQFGPATADVMRNWMGEGRVSPDSLVWREGWRDWQEASGVFPQLGAGGPAGGGFLSPAAPAAAAAARTGRGQSKATNAIIITVLLLAVAILFGVFVYVAFGPKSTKARSERPAGKTATTFSIAGQDAAAPSGCPAPWCCDGGRLA
jgi:hypothetical protein